MPIINSEIGKDVKFWHKDSINIYDSFIGKNTKIGTFVEIGRCRIGNNCLISSFCFLCEGIILEDSVFLGPHVCMTNILTPRAFLNKKSEFKKTVIKKCASIGAMVVIVAGITIGEYALIGAGSVVVCDIEPFSLMVGNPARRIGTVDKIGDTIDRF